MGRIAPKKRERLEFAERIWDRGDEGGRGGRGALMSRCDDVSSDVKSAIVVTAVASSASERRGNTRNLDRDHHATPTRYLSIQRNRDI
jgi:hypothetical protein